MPERAGAWWFPWKAELEPFVLSEDSEEEEPEPIDLETFCLEFVRPGRATITISAEAESTEAEAHLGQRIHAIETNVHVPEGWPEKKDNAALSSLQELT